MRLHPVITSFLLAVGSAALAFLAAVVAARIGLGTVAASTAAAIVIAAAYAVRPVDGVLGFGLLLLLTETVAYWTGVDVRYGDEFGVLLLVVTALTVHRHRLVIPRPGWREAALGTFFVAGVVSSLVHAVPAHVWIPGLALVAKAFLFLYLVISMPVSVDEVRRMSTVALGVALVILAIGVVQFVAPDLATRLLGVYPRAETRGTIQVVNSWFTQPGLYGWLAAFVSLFLLARFTVLRSAWTLALALVVGGAAVLKCFGQAHTGLHDHSEPRGRCIAPGHRARCVLAALGRDRGRRADRCGRELSRDGALLHADAHGLLRTAGGHLRGVRRESESRADHAAPAAGGALCRVAGDCAR